MLVRAKTELAKRNLVSAQRDAESLLHTRAPADIRAPALLVAGDAAYGLQSYAVAAAHYGEFVSSYGARPETPRAAMAMGWAELRQGHREHARQAWTRLADRLATDPRAPLALLFSAELASRGGDAPGTRRLLDRIITQYPDTPHAGIARMTRAALALRDRREDAALRDLEEVVHTQGPAIVGERQTLSQALATPGTEATVEAITRRAATGPRVPRGESTLEQFAAPFLDGRHREPAPYTLHGLVLLAAGDRGWSDVLTVSLATRLLQDFATYPPAPRLLGRVASEAAAAGQWPIARRACETLLAQAPASAAEPGARVLFAEALFRTGAVSQARTIAQSAVAAGGQAAPRALLVLAEVHEAAGERRAALAEYDRLLHDYPRADRTPASLLTHLRLLDELQQGERGAPVLRRLVEVSQGEVAAEGAYRLAERLRADGQHAAAVEWYLTAAYVAQNSRWARLSWLGAGTSLVALNETKDALAVYRKLLPARPGVDPPADRETSGEAAYRLGEILAGSGLHEEALAMFVTSAHYTAGQPAERRALLGAMRCLLATGQRAAAETIHRRLSNAGPLEPAPSALPRVVR